MLRGYYPPYKFRAAMEYVERGYYKEEKFAQYMKHLFYTPTLIAFDENGKEIIRVDSVAHIYRLKSVLEYVVYKIYNIYPDFMSWRFERLFAGKQLPPLAPKQ